LRNFIFIFLFLASVCSLFAETIKWSGEKTISAPVKFEWGEKLKILPGTKVKFIREGQLKAYKGSIDARSVLFSAEAPLKGKSRFEFKNSQCTFIDCEFKNITTEDKRYHNAFFTSWHGTNIFRDNVIVNCSALEFIRSEKPEVSWNIFKGCQKPLVFFHTRYAIAKNNTFHDCSSSSILLNSAENSLILDNRFFNPEIAIWIYRKSIDNIICGVSVFGGVYAVLLRGLPRRNLIARVYTEKTKTGVRLWNNGPGNVISGFSFNDGVTGIQVIEKHKNFPVKFINSKSLEN
jgi:hypothetical protein